MFDELFSQYLERVFPPEYTAMINSAREALVNYEYSLVEANLYKTLPDDSDIDTFQTKITLEKCIKDGFKQVFATLGIRSRLDSIRKMDQLLRAFKNIETSTEHQKIADIISNDVDTQMEMFEKLLQMVVIDEQFLEVVMEFELMDNNDFINRLYDVHVVQMLSFNGEASDERPNRGYLDRIKRFCDKYPQSLVALKLQEKNILFGETYEHYISENNEELQKLYPNFPEKTPIEFLGLAIFANIQRHDLSGFVKTAITKYYADLKFTTKTNYLVDKLIEEVEGNGISQST